MATTTTHRGTTARRQTEQAPTYSQHVWELSLLAPARDADLAPLLAALRG